MGIRFRPRDGHIRDDALYTPLDQIEAGEQAVVRRVSDRDSCRLRRFGDLGLFPRQERSCAGV